VPFERNQRFTGRISQLNQLKDLLTAKDSTTKVAITGLGGVGKTQLVLELLFRMKEKHHDCCVIWISVVNMESLHQSYLEAAQQLGIPGLQDDKADVKRLVQAHLSKESAGKWLLVFDNLDDIDMWIASAGKETQPEQSPNGLFDYMPKSKQGAIIFTTRDRKVAVKLAPHYLVDVPAMEEDAAAELLARCLVNPDLTNNQPDTSTLLLQLTYLPLAIVQAAAYINENAISVADYLSLLAEQEADVVDLLSEEFEDDGRYRDIKNPVATTWLISFDRMRWRDELAADYLSFMACIEPKDIPQSIPPPGPSRKKELEAIGTLTAYSFVTIRPGEELLDLHRLVHLATRNWLRKEKLLVKSTAKALAHLAKVFPEDTHENRSVRRTYLPHARFILNSDLVDKDWATRINLLSKYARSLYADGRWDEAEPEFLEVMERNTTKYGTKDRNTIVAMAWVGATYSKKGLWGKAVELERQIVETTKSEFGLEHHFSLNSMGNLASTYWRQGRWDEAEKLQGQTMEIRMRVLGPKHLETLYSMNSLAMVYRDRGRLREAEKLEEQVLNTAKIKLGIDHPFTLTVMANLASMIRLLGRLKDAERMMVQVLEMRRRVQGPDHPATLIDIRDLASTYQEQHRWDEAEELYAQMLDVGKKRLGTDHPDILTCTHNLALLWKSQGRDNDAINLMRECVDGRKRVTGADHPHTVLASDFLAKWEAESNESQKAVPRIAEETR
jgi:tetratricopeptide (TPR) repeat protein